MGCALLPSGHGLCTARAMGCAHLPGGPAMALAHMRFIREKDLIDPTNSLSSSMGKREPGGVLHLHLFISFQRRA